MLRQSLKVVGEQAAAGLLEPGLVAGEGRHGAIGRVPGRDLAGGVRRGFAGLVDQSSQGHGGPAPLGRQPVPVPGQEGDFPRRHPETRRLPGSLRYLAPPTMVVGVVGGSALGVAGLITGRRWLTAGLLAPLGYVSVISAGSVIFGKRLPLRARRDLPAVYATMHWAWGLGFLVGPPSKAE